MNIVEKYWKFMKILATIGLVYQGFLIVPGSSTFIMIYTGIVAGLAVYSIWFTKERIK